MMQILKRNNKNNNNTPNAIFPRHNWIRTSYLLVLVIALYVVSLCITTTTRTPTVSELRSYYNSDDGTSNSIAVVLHPPSDDGWPPKEFFRNNNNRVVVTITNYDYVDFADNFAQSLLRLNVTNFWIVPTDDRAYHSLHSIYPQNVLPVVPGVASNHGEYRHVRNFGSQAFRDLTALRPVILKRLLQQANHTNLLYNDIDMVWRQNAWDFIVQLQQHSSLEAGNHKNSVILWADGSHQLCSCLLYLEPTKQSFEILDQWSKHVRTGKYKNDQPALNAAIQDNNSSSWMIVRDYERFPHGAYYFGRVTRSVAPGDPKYAKRRSKAVIVHNNWANNKTIKTERFQQHGLWNLSDAMAEHLKREKERKESDGHKRNHH